MANLKIRKGDASGSSGKDKGKEGEAMSVDPAANKAIVEGVNVAKRHQKPTAPCSRAASSTRRCRSTCRTWP